MRVREGREGTRQAKPAAGEACPTATPGTHTYYTPIIIPITNHLYWCQQGGQKREDELLVDLDKRLILVKEHPVDDGGLVLWLVLVALCSPVVIQSRCK
jgi:hypothetical protein